LGASSVEDQLAQIQRENALPRQPLSGATTRWAPTPPASSTSTVSHRSWAVVATRSSRRWPPTAATPPPCSPDAGCSGPRPRRPPQIAPTALVGSSRFNAVSRPRQCLSSA
jgi:hypothetical protein